MTDVDLNQKINDFLSSALEKFMVQDYNNAIRDLKAAEVIDKNNPEILYNLGVNYARLGLHKTAIKYFDKLLALPSGFIENLTAQKLLAYSYIKIKDFDKAKKNLERVIQLSPTDTAAHNMMGYCFEKQKKTIEAIKVYRKIIDIDKHNYNAYNSLAYLLSLSGGNLDESLKYAKIAFESNENSPAYLDTLGVVYLKKGNLEIAEKYLFKALSLFPLSGEIRRHVAVLNRMKGKTLKESKEKKDPKI